MTMTENMADGTYLHRIRGINLERGTSRIVFERENESSRFSDGGRLFIDDSGSQIVFTDFTPDENPLYSVKSVPVKGGDAQLISDSAINGPLIIYFGLTADNQKAIFVAGQNMSGYDFDLYTNSIPVDDELCFLIPIPPSSGVYSCL